MKFTLLFLVVFSLCGCASRQAGVVESPLPTPQNEIQERFITTPRCTTTYALVGEEGASAIPLILDVLDHYAGEENAPTRVRIIQGALYRFACITDPQFAPIVSRGLNDPSEAVRERTTIMVDRAQKRLADEP